jgi:multiple sugar transport system substrate-binding protein
MDIRRIRAVPLLTAALLALAACNGPQTSPSSAPDSSAPDSSTPAGSAAPSASEAAAAYEGPLEWWHLGYTPGGDTPTSQLVDDAVEAYEAANPGIDVTVTGIPFSDEGLAQLDTSLATDEGPDIFRIASDRLPNYGEQGVLSPIDEYLTEDDEADILPNLLEGVEFNGELLAWPQWVPPVGFYLNNTLFADAGVEIPDESWTVDEFKQLAQDLTSEGIYGFATYMGSASVNELTLLYAEGATVLSEDNGEYTLNSEAGAAGLQTLVDLFEADAMPPDSTTLALADVDQGFIDGRFAMITGGSGGTAAFDAGGVEFTVLPPPIGAAGETVTVGGMGTYAVPAKGDPARVAAAHDLARYLTGEVINDVPGWFLAPATRESIDVAAENPLMQPFQDMLPAVRFMPLTPSWPEIDAYIHPEIQLAVAGQKSAQQALDDAGTQITPLIGE